MADIQLTLTAVDKTTGAIQSVQSQVDKVTQKIKEQEKAVKSGESSWTTFNNALGSVEKVLGYVQMAYNAVIAPTLEYANQVRELSRTIGESAEETSRLIQVSDDLGIEYNDLATAAKIAASKGIEFSTDKLAELADEYVKLRPGVERADYLLERFGRSGLQMGKLLEQGSDAIKDMNKDVAANMIMTEKQLKSARNLEIAMDNLQDSFTGVSNELGNTLIPYIAAITEGFNKFTAEAADAGDSLKFFKDYANPILQAKNWIDLAAKSVGAYGEQNKETITTLKELPQTLGAVNSALADNTANAQTWAKNYEDAAKSASDAMKSGVRDMVDGKLGQAFDDFETKTAELKEENRKLNDELKLLASQGYSPLGATMQGVSAKISENGQKQRDLKTDMDKTTQAMIFQKLAANMDAGAMALLGQDMGLLSAKDAALIVETEKFTKAIDLNEDGIVSQTEYLEGQGRKALENYRKALEENSGKTYINQVMTKYMVENLDYNTQSQQAIQGFANGGNFTVPTGYPNDSYLMGVTSGEQVSVTPQGKSGANVTVNVNWGGGGSQQDARSFAKYLKDEIRKQVQYA